MNPKISVISTMYNVEEYLPKCVKSVLSQTFSDFEYILVNDASPDNCHSLCEEYARQDKRIKLCKNENNIGLPQSRKKGFELSSGDYILFLDPDDYIETDALEKLYEKAVSGDFDMVYCDIFVHDSAGAVTRRKIESLSNDAFENIKRHILGFSLSTVVWNKLIKRSVYKDINFSQVAHNEDKYLTTQTLYYSKKIGYVEAHLHHAFHHPNSLSNNPKKEKERYICRTINLNNVLGFLKSKYGEDLSAFEPELSARIKCVENMNPDTIRFKIRKITRKHFSWLIRVKKWIKRQKQS